MATAVAPRDPDRDLVLVNGSVWATAHTSLAVRDGRIAAIGDAADARAAAGPRARVIDLAGRPVLPGFTDSHTHFHRTAILGEHFLDFAADRPATVADVLAAVGARARRYAPGRWIEGDNLMATGLAERRFPTRWELDSVAPDQPVLLRSTGKHVGVVNSLALRLAGIDERTDDPPGGRIERTPDGTPTGVLHERAKLRLDTTRADTVVPSIALADRLAALRSGIAGLQRLGITAIHEITRTPAEFGDYQRLWAEGELGIRVVAYVRVVEARAGVEDFARLGLRSGFGDPMLRIGGVKISIDGSCAYRNAAIYGDYPGMPGHSGLVRIAQDELDATVAAAHAQGLQIAVHAIGQRAVDMALDAYARAAPPEELRALRHRIEHAYLPARPGQLERMRDLGLILSTQPAFIASMGDSWIEIFGAAGIDDVVPLRTALDLGITTQANSDLPSASAAPLDGIRAAMSRVTRSGVRLGRRQSISAPEAVAMYTAVPAYTAGEESWRGSLNVGMAADLVVLDADPARLGEDELAGLRVDLTTVGGGVVFDREAASAG